MAKNDTAVNSPGKKKRWYDNFVAAFKVTKRSYPQIGWIMLAATIAAVAFTVVITWLLNFHVIAIVVFALTMTALVPMMILALLVKRAMYKQIDGTIGAVYGVISQLRRGWSVEEEPVAANRQRDLVWRIVGRAGVVLLAEGPKNRVRELVERQSREDRRIVTNVPVHCIYVGNGDGQVPLGSVEKELRRLPKKLHRNEVPLVVNRLLAMKARRQAPIPQGIDPKNAKISRRALRGR